MFLTKHSRGVVKNFHEVADNVKRFSFEGLQV